MTVRQELQLVPVISSDFKPSHEVGLAVVDKLGLIVQLPLLANQNLYVDSHINFSSESVAFYVHNAGRSRGLGYTEKCVQIFYHD